ncbi:ATP:cob(I)alamin adenosyltransferase [Dyadobacter sp. BE34]|uniref:Corrinoid adenosyltransferase n=1 Tax=Dyadobacter fermentans TaxID=94254 RepID=A0ABU1QTC6_9BACT|nr:MULTISPECIES: cob(I)yrinic acid a,c-diamide adenosyltransferase [Dyadobacter]MDR6804424.1 ATP:cob(I)alamin adenosyltransferase [Dyadobacter fermentans]MDR7042164.1 ATP:cob(I)alamin adenosyltransferase [Dyadobacter sp. BE242]MDR7196566.1 ATP:cob(I)alamin adenosyltransferase [Dyadobacter sp. BE34]MDR7212888.1 ATP:cob(I)alamin adenosyltransferase [Dyadobacter sp. BE31]MDR7261973.1 ATP:cob(I)alamin adenosyltransferase [Dyadobacter sp. BE32]
MKIYTKKGDKGTTGLFGGSRVSKDDVRIECIGTLDEANSTIGLLRVKLGDGHEWQPNLHKIQKDLMDMMSHLARPSDAKKENKNPMPVDGATFCEEWIDALEAAMTSPSDYFLLPGGNEVSALCHVARTQLRRGERSLVSLIKTDEVHEAIPAYINRLSDLFFTLARAEMDKAGVAEEKWQLFLYKRFKSAEPS